MHISLTVAVLILLQNFALSNEYGTIAPTSGWLFSPGVATKLFASDGNVDDGFGHSIAVCDHFSVVGSPYDQISSRATGSAYIFGQIGGLWQQTNKMHPGDLGLDGDFFGGSVACASNSTAVGAHLDDSSFADAGAVYLYDYYKGKWKFSTKLLSSYGEENEYFGYSVALAEKLLFVGAIGSSQSGEFSGIVYAYRKERDFFTDDLFDDGMDNAEGDGGWTMEAVLYPSGLNTQDRFGLSMAVSGSVIVIGAPNMDSRRGAVFVYNRSLVYNENDDDLVKNDEAIDQPSYKMLSILSAGASAAQREFFGHSVAIHAHTIVVGQYLAFHDDGTQSGAAHVFTTHTSGSQLSQWDHVAVLTEPISPPKQNHFGHSVAVRDNSIIVGAPGGDKFSNSSAYAFIRYMHSDTPKYLRSQDLLLGHHYSFWSHQATLIPNDRVKTESNVVTDKFGWSIAIGKDGVAVIGSAAAFGRYGYPSGAVYSYVGQAVSSGGPNTDDDEIEGVITYNPSHPKDSRAFAWLVLLIFPFCVITGCFYMSKRRRRRRGGKSTLGRSFGEGAGHQAVTRIPSNDKDSDISDLDDSSFFGSDVSFRHIRGAVKNKINMLSAHAKDWMAESTQNPIFLSSAESEYSAGSSSENGMDRSMSTRGLEKIFKMSSKGTANMRPKRSSQQVLATARAVANDMNHPNQEEVAILLRSHEKDWITEEKFMETLEELVY